MTEPLIDWYRREAQIQEAYLEELREDIRRVEYQLSIYRDLITKLEKSHETV